MLNNFLSGSPQEGSGKSEEGRSSCNCTKWSTQGAHLYNRDIKRCYVESDLGDCDEREVRVGGRLRRNLKSEYAPLACARHSLANSSRGLRLFCWISHEWETNAFKTTHCSLQPIISKDIRFMPRRRKIIAAKTHFQERRSSKAACSLATRLHSDTARPFSNPT